MKAIFMNYIINFGLAMIIFVLFIILFKFVIFFKFASDEQITPKVGRTILICITVLFLIVLGVEIEGSIYYKEIDVVKEESIESREIAKGNSRNELNFNGMGIATYYSIKSDNSNKFVYWYISDDGSYMQDEITINDNFKVYEIEDDRCYIESIEIVTISTYKSGWFGEKVIKKPLGGTLHKLYVPKGTIIDGNVTLE